MRHEGLKKLVERGLWIAGSHTLGRSALRSAGGGPIDDPRLRTDVAGLEMDGPVGLAPGWDKIGHTIQAWQALGAHHITLGAAPLFSQSGNPTPRLRTIDKRRGDHGTKVSQNAFGFNSRGIDQLIYNIYTQRQKEGVNIPVIVQLTVNKEFYSADLRQVIRPILVETVKRALRLFDGVSVVDGVSIGLSSPNTQGMRTMQDDLKLWSELINAVGYTVKEIDPNIPLIVKGDGDGGEERLDRYAWAVEAQERRIIDAFELINTTRLKHILAKYGVEGLPGGLAGDDPGYKQLALGSIRYLYERVGGIIDIIGTGGGASQAHDMIEAGASAVGINTGVRSRGLTVMRKVEQEIIERIDREHPGATALDQIVGVKTKRGPKYLAKETPEEAAARFSKGVRTGDYRAV